MMFGVRFSLLKNSSNWLREVALSIPSLRPILVTPSEVATLPLRHISSRSQLISAWSITPLLVAFQFELQAQILQIEFVGALPLLFRPQPLLFGLQPLLIAFQNQPTKNRFQRFPVLR